MLKRLLLPALMALALAAASFQIQAQPGGAVQAIAPLTRDLGALKTFTAFAVTSTAQVTADQNGYNVSRVICLYNQASGTGSPSVTMAVQNKDVASGQYYTLLTSAALATVVANSQLVLSIGAGNASSANSSPMAIAKTWRVSVIASGSGTVTGTVGCSVQ